MSYADRIRNGDVRPWVGDGYDGARRSAAIVADELATLDRDDPRRDELVAQLDAWNDRALALEAGA